MYLHRGALWRRALLIGLALIAGCFSAPSNAEHNSPWMSSDVLVPETGTDTQFVGVIVRSGINVRSGPGFHCDVIDRLKLGSEVQVFRKSTQWYEVDLTDGISGWMISRYVKKSPVSQPVIPAGISSEILIDAMTGEALTLAPPILEGYITGNRVNVRESPEREGAFITKVSRGQRVEIIEETGGWIQIRLLGDRRGWIFDEMVQDKEDIIGTVTGNGVNVRAEGGIYFDVLTKVYKGMKVPIIDKQDDWYQIVLPDGKVGWMIDRYLQPPEPKPPDAELPAGVTSEIREVPSEDFLQEEDSLHEDEELLLELKFR